MMMDNNSIRKDILDMCERAKKQAENIVNDLDRHIIIRKLAELSKKRVCEISDICSVERYRLYFIGKVGIGKSTAISHLIGLVDQGGFEIGKNIGNIPILKVGNGRTTAFETEIIPTPEQSRIVIDKMSSEELRHYVSEFCDLFFHSEEMKKYDISVEHKKIICNMSGFPNKNGEPLSEEKELQKYIEEAGLEDCSYNKENLANAIIKNIDYENRKKAEFIFDGNCGEFGSWLKEMIAKINSGTLEGMLFPEKLYVYVNQNDFPLRLEEYVESIVDTRGIDQSGSGKRQDIEDVMKRTDSISILCDGVGGIGADAALNKILKDVLIDGEMDLQHRIFVMGIGKGIDSLRTDDGAVYEDNLEAKRRQGLNALNNGRTGMPLEETHVIFYEPLVGVEYKTGGKIISDTNKIDYDKEKDSLWEDISNSVYNMFKKYHIEVSDIENNLNKLKFDEVSDELAQKFRKAREYVIEEQKQITEGKLNFFYELGNHIRACKAGVIRASVNRMGSYYSLNVYDESAEIGAASFFIECWEAKNTLLAKWETLFEEKNFADKNSINLIALNEMKQAVESKYKEYHEKISKHYRDCTKKCIGNDWVLWNQMCGYWGQGAGYTKRVIDNIEKELKNEAIEKMLKEKNYYMEYLKEVEKFFDI